MALDFRPVFFIVGVLLTILSVAMLLPAVVDAAGNNPDWKVFLAASGLTLFVGVSMVLTSGGQEMRLGVREAFVLTTLSWVAITAFAALPFLLADLSLSFTDAFFEAMSGVTTTGATVIQNLQTVPPGILLWRALLQWLGGIGIIVMAIAILPMLQVGGMQLFRTESSDRSEKVLPRAAQLANAVGSIYVALTAICAASYWIAGMPGFDAVAHAMTTIATGGFSTRDESVGFFDNAAVDWIAVVFMIFGSLPFVLYLQVVRGRPLMLLRDAQVQWFLAVVITLVVIVTMLLSARSTLTADEALRLSAFNTVSIITGTGYATAAFDQWGPFASVIFFLIMFVGGCAGSTTCGIKIFRIQVLASTAASQIKQLLSPHGVFIPYYNRRPIEQDVAMSVLSFFFFYVLIFVALTVLLGVLGLDFKTALSGAASAISNVGPGLGETIGPAVNYMDVPNGAKWVLATGMLLGRLELFTILVLFIPAFWRA